MTKIECFMLERTDLARELLYRTELGECPAQEQRIKGYHRNKRILAPAIPYNSQWEGESKPIKDHPDAPTRCLCGREFPPDVEVRHYLGRLYRDPRNHQLILLEEAAPGAMYFADWYTRVGWHGADRRSLVVILPDLTPWLIDGPAQNAPGKIPGWTRHGEPPKVVASPSIQTPGYHGFLGGSDGSQPGFLVEC
jgi:hypothetical protein